MFHEFDQVHKLKITCNLPYWASPIKLIPSWP